MKKQWNCWKNTLFSFESFTQCLKILHKHCLQCLWHLESLIVTNSFYLGKWKHILNLPLFLLKVPNRFTKLNRVSTASVCTNEMHTFLSREGWSRHKSTCLHRQGWAKLYKKLDQLYCLDYTHHMHTTLRYTTIPNVGCCVLYWLANPVE